jgi:hypothetical protein
MDKGFQQWFAKTVITYLKARETRVIQEELELQYRREQKTKTRFRRCVWSIFSSTVTLLGWLKDALILMCGFCILCFMFTCMIASYHYFICVWTPPLDRCLLYELQLKNGTTILSSEEIWPFFDCIIVWQATLGFVANELYNTTLAVPPIFVFGSVLKRVCELVEDRQLGILERWSGVYKLPF